MEQLTKLQQFVLSQQNHTQKNLQDANYFLLFVQRGMQILVDSSTLLPFMFNNGNSTNKNPAIEEFRNQMEIGGNDYEVGQLV